MEKSYTFSHEESIIPFGFIYYDEKPQCKTLETILKDTIDGLVIFDTKDQILSSLLSSRQDLLNDTNVKFIALTSYNVLQKLTSLGVRGGFFRSTTVKSEVAILVINKKKVFWAVDPEHVFEAYPVEESEVFDYINHLIWSKADFEVIQGSKPSPVKALRLSVVRPIFQEIKTLEGYSNIPFVEGTEEFHAERLLLNTPETSRGESRLTLPSIHSLGFAKKGMLVKVFEDLYMSCPSDNSMIIGESFSQKPLKSLLGKRVWIDGKEQPIEEKSTRNQTVYKPLDEYRTFKPDFKQYVDEKKGMYTCQVNVVVDVLPLPIDSTYALSKRYRTIQSMRDTLQNRLGELRKLIKKDDEVSQQQIERTMKERDLIEQIRLYNEFIEKIQVGDSTMINSKNNHLKPISIEKRDFQVPNELIGKLYEKQGKMFLALKDEEKIADAQKWLKENNEIAVLVKDRE